MANAPPPMAAATRSAPSRSRSTIATVAPEAARRTAMASPIPVAAPVTMAVWPFSGRLIGVLASVVAFGHQLGHCQQRTLVGRIGEFVDNVPGLVGERLRAFFHALDAVIFFEQRENLREAHFLITA